MPKLTRISSAYTEVDNAESNVEKAYMENAVNPVLIAAKHAAKGEHVLHMSTDYVFDGQAADPYDEHDAPNPINVYGASKLAGEEGILGLSPKNLIVRTAWLFGATGDFVDTILKKLQAGSEYIYVVADQIGSPTYRPDLYKNVASLCEKGCPDSTVIHVVNSGSASWWEVARAVAFFGGHDVDRVRIQGTRGIGRPAKRPAYSVLSTDLAKDMGLYIRPWYEALEEYLTAGTH